MLLREIKKIKVKATPEQTKFVKELHDFCREVQKNLEKSNEGWQDLGLGGIGIFSGGDDPGVDFRDNENDGTRSNAATKRASKKVMIDTFNSTLKKFPNLKDIFNIQKIDVEPEMSEIYYHIPFNVSKREEIEKALNACDGWADMKDWRD